MKLIKPSFTIIEQESINHKMDASSLQKNQQLLDGIYKMIELAGRTCYKSEDKITEDSARDFVDRMIKSGHGAMLEHGTVYLIKDTELINTKDGNIGYNPLKKYNDNKYSMSLEYGSSNNSTFYVTTNLRVLVENGWMDDLKYLCEPTRFHMKRVTVRFICDRGVSHEFVRHRVFSFAQESTRYCNYSKDKFGNELTFIKPCWCNMSEGSYILCTEQNKEDLEFVQVMKNFEKDEKYPLSSTSNGRFLCSMYQSERYYLDLIEKGWKPQQARAVLPNSLKTELVMTGFVSDWKHFFELRDAGSAHPQAQELAKPLHEEFIKRGYINE